MEGEATAAAAVDGEPPALFPRPLVGVGHLARRVDGPDAPLESETYSDDSFLAETRLRFVKAMAALLLVHFWTLGPGAVNPDKILEWGGWERAPDGAGGGGRYFRRRAAAAPAEEGTASAVVADVARKEGRAP